MHRPREAWSLQEFLGEAWLPALALDTKHMVRILHFTMFQSMCEDSEIQVNLPLQAAKEASRVYHGWFFLNLGQNSAIQAFYSFSACWPT
eukprot:2826548-Amphidinium_carterae.1